MNSIRLRYFIVVTETESIRKAAEALHISPAALSKAIKQLEYEVGITLLARAGRGIVITAEGRELAHRARPLIENIDKLKLDFTEKKKLTVLNIKPLRIGSFEIFTTHFLSLLLNALPDLGELMLREVIPVKSEKSLLANEIDYGITNIPIPLTGILHQAITSFELQIFGRKEIFGTTSFVNLPFATPMVPIIGTLNSIKELDCWPEGKISRSIKYRVEMLESALELCRQGKAVAYLPSFLIKLQNRTVKSEYNLQAIPLPEGMLPQQQMVYLARRRAEEHNPISEKIIQTIRAVCEKT